MTSQRTAALRRGVCCGRASPLRSSAFRFRRMPSVCYQGKGVGNYSKVHNPFGSSMAANGDLRPAF